MFPNMWNLQLFQATSSLEEWSALERGLESFMALRLATSQSLNKLFPARIASTVAMATIRCVFPTMSMDSIRSLLVLCPPTSSTLKR